LGTGLAGVFALALGTGLALFTGLAGFLVLVLGIY
jgi:hypothetical protein